MSAQGTTNNYVAAIIFSDKAIFYLLSDSIMCSCSFIGYTCVGTVGSMEKLKRFRVCLTAPAFMMYRRLDILGFCSVQRLFSRKAIYRTAPNYQSNLTVALFGLNIFELLYYDSPAKHYFLQAEVSSYLFVRYFSKRYLVYLYFPTLMRYKGKYTRSTGKRI